MLRPIETFIAICVCANFSVAQPYQSPDNILGNGIYFRGGVGHLAVRDGYISDEKYSGTISSFSLSWLRGDTSAAYRLGLDYLNASDVKNNNVSAQLMQAGLNLDFLYSIGGFQLFSHDIIAYLGPSADISL
ncbi:MAG TPA: hypothetical protein VI704_00575 [Bacteroidota bacterium]|nr:hypothetical protein [Bacteroidota bacterium]